MFRFRSFENAASFALRCCVPALVFDGPEDDYVVAVGHEARQLQEDSHKPYTLTETAKISREEQA